MVENFNDVTAAFGNWLQTVTAERTTGSYVNGGWVENAPNPLSFSAVVQAANFDDLKTLPEGLRTEEAIKIHTKFELIPQIADTTTGDKITYDGQIWLVHSVAARKIGGYFKALAIKQ